MNINLFLVFFVVIYGFLLSKKDSRSTRKSYIIVTIAVLNFVAAMRNPEWFTNHYEIDSSVYRDDFEKWREMDWMKIMMEAYLRYFGGEGNGDIGYIIINRIIGLFTGSFHIFSLLVNLLFFVPFGKILYRYSSHIFQIMFAFVFYIAMLQVLFIAGGRQLFAIGFDMMALMALMNKNIPRTILLYILGITIHFSSILFIIPLAMIWCDVKPKQLKLIHIICFMLFPVVMLYPGQLITYMGNFIGMEKYAKYGEGANLGGPTTFIIMIETLSLFCYVVIKKSDLLNNEILRNFYVMIPFFSFFSPLVYFSGSMIRISLYFHLFLFVIVPHAIECLSSHREKMQLYSVAIGVLALYAIRNGMDYYFFWQTPSN